MLQCSLTSGTPFHLAIHHHIPGLLHPLHLLFCATLISSAPIPVTVRLLAVMVICTHIALQKHTLLRHRVSVFQQAGVDTFDASIVSKFNGCVTGVTTVRTLLPPIRDRGVCSPSKHHQCCHGASQTAVFSHWAREVVDTSEVKTQR